MPSPPLAHLRVVDLTDLRAALAGRILADLGADVIKVEPPGGDPGRLVPPFAGNVPAPDRSLPFLYRNAGKRGAVIDLDEPPGRERFEALLAAADVLVENLGPAGEERRRLRPEDVRARHPHLIQVAIADFGLSGPHAGWQLESLPALAASGALWASGFSDRPPCSVPGHLAHDCASIVGVLGALAAMLERAQHGHGQTVEVSVQEAAIAALDPWGIELADYARAFPILPDSYPRDGEGPALVLPTADGYIRVLAVTPRQWRAFAALLTRGAGPRNGDASSRADAHDGTEFGGLLWRALAHLPIHGAILPLFHAALGTLRFLAGRALQGRPRAEVLAEARRLGLPIAPVNTPDEFVREEQTRVRGYFRATGFPHVGAAPFASFPCNFGATPAILARPAPVPGDDHGGFEPCAWWRPPDTRPGGLVLQGIRVVDLGVGVVVPDLCRHLAELGADVVKIESRGHLDFLRRLSIEGSPDHSFTFNHENRGQRSVCLDLATPRGRELALALCARADVVAENRQGGVVARWGLDYQSVRRVRPDVIYVSSQGFGRGGPLGEAPAFGMLNAAFAGVSYLWNHADAPYPAGSALEHPDHLAGKLGAVAVLAALEHRRRTGEGQLIEMSQSEFSAYLMGEFYLEGPCTGRPARPHGNSVAHACPHGVYPAAGHDRWIAIAVMDDAAFDRFRRRLGWPIAEELATLAGRLASCEALDARVAEWTRRYDADEAVRILQNAGVSAMTVQGPEDHRADPHLAARRALDTVAEDIGRVRHVGSPLRLDRTPVRVLGPAPHLGAHTAAVLNEVLGLPPGEIARLVADGVCG
jgi:crotonobetainyl-CoA:carnitine CoA-transferase CaiB-like acyl-CoA transferase